MSGTECARCGGVVNPEGNCSVCGVPQAPGAGFGTQPMQQFPPPDAQPFLAAGGQREMPKGQQRPAFLFNKLTNDRFALTQSVSKIGRDQTNNIPITNDHYISRHHAWVLQMQGGYWVEDLGSTNGTMLNGEPLNERRQIFPGDRLTFGKTELIFVVE
ncbi:MAG TPA: FHA domain-containing protein [Chroococcales cyanobacterium]